MLATGPVGIGPFELILLLVVLGVGSIALYYVRGPGSSIAVPGWIGPVGVVLSLFSVVPWLVFSAAMYWKGKSDGVGTATDEQPRGNALWAALGWIIVATTVIFTWYAIVHLPTMLYREGVRVGRAESR